jgi:hypothetical protein
MNENLVWDPDDWLRQNFPTFWNTLLLEDEKLGGIIFQDPQHRTISWHIATLAKAGNPVAKLGCEILNLYQPDHCAKVLAEGN